VPEHDEWMKHRMMGFLNIFIVMLPVSGTYGGLQRPLGTVSSGVKQQEYEADDLSSARAKDKNV
jgi:hypothetical protein